MQVKVLQHEQPGRIPVNMHIDAGSQPSRIQEQPRRLRSLRHNDPSPPLESDGGGSRHTSPSILYYMLVS